MSISIPFHLATRENLRKITICRDITSGVFGPGADNRFFGFQYSQQYNITDMNVRVSFTHPIGSDVIARLSKKPEQASPTSAVLGESTLFHIADNITSTTFNMVIFDDDATKTIPTEATNDLTINGGFYQPANGDLDATFVGMDTEGFWAIEMVDKYAENPAAITGKLTEFCLIVVTNTPKDVRRLVEYKVEMEEQGLRIRET